MGCCLGTRPQLESETSSTPTENVQASVVSDCDVEGGEQEQGNLGNSGPPIDQPKDLTSFLGAVAHTDENGKTDYEEIPGLGLNQPEGLPSSTTPATHTDENKEVVITSIRAADVALGLRRIPAGFYVVVQHSGLEWRTENKHSLVNNDVVEWGEPIPIPFDLSATFFLGIYASFEFQPMLGDGEELRTLNVTVEQLLDRSVKHVGGRHGILFEGRDTNTMAAFTFLPKDGDVVSPCSSISVTIKHRKCESSDSSMSKALAPHRLMMGSRCELEEATNEGHAALSHYQKHSEEQDLDRSIQQFERALNICPLEHPCRAAAQSNLAIAKFIHCQVKGADTSFDVPLTLYHNALAARPVGHIDRPSTLIQLAVVYFVRFDKWGDEVEIARAEALLHEAMELSSAESHENRAATFGFQLHAGRRANPVQAGDQSPAPVEQHAALSSTDQDPWALSLRLLDRFKQFGDLAELQQAIAILEELVKPASVWDDRYYEGLFHLGLALSYRFERLGELSDLEEAISRHRHAIDLIPDGHPDKPNHLNSLTLCLRARFHRLGELSDLQEAISRQRFVVDVTPDDHPHKLGRLANLANSLQARFRRLGELSDLEEAILMHRDAVDLIPDDHLDKPSHLTYLGLCFRARFERLGELSDLEEAISMHRNAVGHIPDAHPDKPSHLTSLGLCFQTRSEYLGELGDLEEAISKHRNAIYLIPDGHPNKPACLANLGNSLQARFRRLGRLSDLEEAILRHRNAVDLVPDAHPDTPSYLSDLALCFQVRFERLGELRDLEEAISVHRNAVDHIPDSHPDKPGHLTSLGLCFQARSERLGEVSDLEEAISRHRNAIDLIPDGHPNKHACLANLGNSLQARFRRLGGMTDLEEAILRHRNAVDLVPDAHPNKPNHLNNLALCFRARFHRLGELSDLEEAVSRQRNAINLIPDGHPDRSACLTNLGNILRARFWRLGELSDLEEAILRHRNAIDVITDGHPDKPSYLSDLGLCFQVRFEHLGDLSDLEQAISLYSNAASTITGRTIVRFHASLKWISCARVKPHHSLFHAYSFAIGLLPQLAWIGLSLTHRYQELVQGADVVCQAAAAALDLGLPEIAVEWLEQGRSIVWGELFQLRSSHEELSSIHPDHAHRLRELSAALDSASAMHEKSLSSLRRPRESDLQQEVDRHRTLAIERDKLLQEIRRLPGFERFLLHKEFSQLRASAHSGPVVILNAADNRCDALIIRADVDHVIHVPLPNFTFQRCVVFQNMLKSLLGHARVLRCGDLEREGRIATLGRVSWEPLLSTLWKGIVKPVLDALAISITGDPSRIFWCPTGPFVFLPIHAAGSYGIQYSQPGHKVSDFVVSSYVPTLSILGSSASLDVASNSDIRLLAVRQPLSDGLSRLPGVNTELEHIRRVIRNSPLAQTTILEPSVGTVEEVLSLMKEADWVHFACHGIQDAENPTESGLCLADQRRLKLRDIIALSRPRSGLAFLSACQTAMGDENLSDEAVHIAAGMMFAGYSGVVGTMWSISDKLAPHVAKDVYGQLFRNGTRPDYREAARALHEAVGRLRDSNASFAEWLPFIHVGL